MNRSNGRLTVPPHDDVAERHVIGSLLQGADDERVAPTHFHHEGRRTLAEAIFALRSEGQFVAPDDSSPRSHRAAVDQNISRIEVFIGDAWKGADTPRKELAACFDAAVLPENLEHSTRQLVETYRRRKVQHQCAEASQMAADPTVGIDEIEERLATAAVDVEMPRSPQPVSFSELRSRHRQLKRPIVEGLLRQGETMNVVAPTKVGKSWLAQTLALSVATGRTFLGRFHTTPGRVLIVDNELHAETLTDRLCILARALRVPLESLDGQLDIACLRGGLVDVYGLSGTLGNNKADYQLVILDALYRMLPAGTSENDNAAIAQIYNTIDLHANRLNCGFVAVHHSTKGNQSNRGVTDVGAGAGSQSRAVDAHVVLRQHQDDHDCYVMDCVTRSWAVPEPLVLRWDFPLWSPDDDLDPSRLKLQETPAAARQRQNDSKGEAQIIEAILSEGRPVTPYRLAKATKMGKERVNRLVAKMVEDGTLYTPDHDGRGTPFDIARAVESDCQNPQSDPSVLSTPKHGLDNRTGQSVDSSLISSSGPIGSGRAAPIGGSSPTLPISRSAEGGPSASPKQEGVA